MVKIRQGKESDLTQVLALIIELAKFERAEKEVKTTVQSMQQDGFGKAPLFEFIVAEDADKIIGISLYYWRYSTWKGKRIYLEDLIVTEKYRGQGIGKQLFEETMAIGKSKNATGMMWQVLDWNSDSIAFYKRYPTRINEEWLNCNIDFKA